MFECGRIYIELIDLEEMETERRKFQMQRREESMPLLTPIDRAKLEYSGSDLRGIIEMAENTPFNHKAVFDALQDLKSKTPAQNETRYKKCFAWLPVRLSSLQLVWLKSYNRTQIYHFGKWYWTDWCKINLPDNE